MSTENLEKKELSDGVFDSAGDAIVTDPVILSQVSRDTDFKECLKLKLFDRLPAALAKGWTSGVGLAAIQIGLPLRFAYYRDSSKPMAPPMFLINPRILLTGSVQPHRNEGCLSVPNRRFQTWRYNHVTYEKLVNGQMQRFEATGFEAVIIQHEVDHMDGVLCSQRVGLAKKVGRNEVCPCGSGKKSKRCCK